MSALTLREQFAAADIQPGQKFVLTTNPKDDTEYIRSEDGKTGYVVGPNNTVAYPIEWEEVTTNFADYLDAFNDPNVGVVVRNG